MRPLLVFIAALVFAFLVGWLSFLSSTDVPDAIIKGMVTFGGVAIGLNQILPQRH
ncbi:hypothetical protein ACTG9Q_32535 [Actinokineospora sp. 24-640]